MGVGKIASLAQEMRFKAAIFSSKSLQLLREDELPRCLAGILVERSCRVDVMLRYVKRAHTVNKQ